MCNIKIGSRVVLLNSTGRKSLFVVKRLSNDRQRVRLNYAIEGAMWQDITSVRLAHPQEIELKRRFTDAELSAFSDLKAIRQSHEKTLKEKDKWETCPSCSKPHPWMVSYFDPADGPLGELRRTCTICRDAFYEYCKERDGET